MGNKEESLQIRRIDKMTEKEWLDRVRLGAKIYNEGRLHRDFQAAEVDKFVEWLYKQYGVVYKQDKLI